MLPKKNRIKNKKDFDNIFKTGRNFKLSPLILKTLENGLGCSRFGFVVSTKISKKAVVRNKLRRRLSEIAFARLKDKNTKEDFVFIALPGAEAKSFEELKGVCGKLFKKAQNV